MLGVRAEDVAWPAGDAPGEGGRSAAVAAGTARIRTGDMVVFFKPVAAVRASVRRDGRVQAQGSPCDHARLGVLEARLEAMCGPGTIGRLAAGIRLCGPDKKPRNRLLAAAFVIRVLLLMTPMPGLGSFPVMSTPLLRTPFTHVGSVSNGSITVKCGAVLPCAAMG